MELTTEDYGRLIALVTEEHDHQLSAAAAKARDRDMDSYRDHKAQAAMWLDLGERMSAIRWGACQAHGRYARMMESKREG